MPDEKYDYDYPTFPSGLGWSATSDSEIMIDMTYMIREMDGGGFTANHYGKTFTGVVTFQLSADGELYRNGVLVRLEASQAQQRGQAKGFQVYGEILSDAGNNYLRPIELSALAEAANQGVKIIPESWKATDGAMTPFIFAWDIIFVNNRSNSDHMKVQHGNLVAYAIACYEDQECHPFCVELTNWWHSNYMAAVY